MKNNYLNFFYSEHHDTIGESDDVGASQESDGDATQMRTYRGK